MDSDKRLIRCLPHAVKDSRLSYKVASECKHEAVLPPIVMGCRICASFGGKRYSC